MGVQIPAPPFRSSGLCPAPPDLKGLLLLGKGSCPRCRVRAGCRVPRRCLAPRGAQTGSVSCHKVLTTTYRPLSAPGQHLQLVPCLQAEGQQKSTESVLLPQIAAWPSLGCGIQQLRKWPSTRFRSHPTPSPTAAEESGAQRVQPLALLIPLNTHCARRASCSWQP